jgi:hypothetical protein
MKPARGPEDLLPPVLARAGGSERKTHKMMQHDLAVAWEVRLEEFQSPLGQEAFDMTRLTFYASGHRNHVRPAS